MRRYLVLVAGVIPLMMVSTTFAMTKADERLQSAATVLDEVLNVPDDIPLDLIDKAKCVVVIPSVKKLAIGFGGSYGRGAMVCRGGTDFAGPWGPPVMMALEGGSFGFQLGGQATDFVLLVMNSGGVDSLLSSKVKLGADLSAAAGPKGRTASAETDVLMSAEILSYSRAHGLFAGVSLEGSTLRPDNESDEQLYGRKIAAREIVHSGQVKVPEYGKSFVSRLEKASPHLRAGAQLPPNSMWPFRLN